MLEEKKEQYKKEIDNIIRTAYNDEQKVLAKYIIDQANENNIDAIYTLITQRVKLGFVFDSAPEVNHNCVALCERNEELSFGNIINSCGGGALNNHKLIIGENYDALKNLLATYTKDGKGLVDFIYIDPPYNTESMRTDGNDYKNDDIKPSKFVYRDKFTRTGWLNMMRERLVLAKKLLSDQGVIFISIDDTEQAYLKVLCDEVFGEENFVGMLNVLDNLKGKENDKFLSYTSHYILIYKKIKKEDDGFNIIPTGEQLQDKYSLIDENGNIFTTNTFKKTGAGKNREDRPRMFYPILYKDSKLSLLTDDEYENIYKNGKFEDDNLEKICQKYKKQNYEIILPIDKNNNYLRWTSGFENCKELIKNNELLYQNGSIVQKKFPKDIEIISNSVYGTPKNFIYKQDFANGTNELNELNLSFPNPKSKSLIKYLIKLLPNNKNSIILDFFAGSGTTGQAVMELNEEDGGNRQCILATNNENDIGITCRERLYRVVNGKGSKGEEIKWTYSKDKKCLQNNYWDVFDIKYYELKIDEYDKAKELLIKAKIKFKELNINYDSKDFDIYNQLSSLRPYVEEKKE